MVKKLLTFAFGLLMLTGLKAQTDATIAFEDIRYWVGEGSDSAVLIVNFGRPDTAFAWGYLFDDTATVQQMTDAITAADPRFWVVGLPSYYPDGDIFFVIDNGDTLKLSGIDDELTFNYWEANINGQTSYDGASQALVNGDVFKYGDLRAPSRVCLNEMEYEGETYCLLSAWTKAPTPVSDPNAPVEPQPEEATIAASEVTYWVGQGSNQVVLAVNWADTALAWGYRFSTDSVSVQQVMDAIMAADHRFSYTMDGYYLGDINFVLGGTDTFGITPGNYFESKRNGISDAGMSQNLGNGDFEKWADPAAGVVVDSVDYGEYGIFYIYVYPMTIYPVSDPAGIASVENLSVSVFPNPAAAMVNVTFDALEQSAEAALYDMSGRAVYRRSLAAGSTGVQVPVNQLGEGVYLLRVAGAAAKVVVSR